MILNRVTLPHKSSWTILEFEAEAIVLATKRLPVNIFLKPFRIFTNHQALEHLDKVGELHPRVLRRVNT